VIIRCRLIPLITFLKANIEHDLKMNISCFCGDGHHDSNAHYRYFNEKGIIPIIPLSKNTQNAFPHTDEEKNIRLDKDGTPLCLGGVRMRHHGFNKKKQTHVYCCPIKRSTHRNGKHMYIAHEDECPNKTICEPESSIKPIIYIKSETDPRLYPPIPRSSNKFKELMKQRSASERCNAVNDSYHIDGSCRNADYGLIRITFANVIEHALIRNKEYFKEQSKSEIFSQTVNMILNMN
jgi:hypothetical protein